MRKQPEPMTKKLEKQIKKYEEAHKAAWRKAETLYCLNVDTMPRSEIDKWIHLAIGYLEAFHKLKLVSSSHYFKQFNRILAWEKRKYSAKI